MADNFKWELRRLNDRVLEVSRLIVAGIEQGHFTAIGHRELVSSLEGAKEMADNLPKRSRAEQ